MIKKIVFSLVIIMVLSLVGGLIAYSATGGFDPDSKQKIVIDEEKIYSIDDVTDINISTSSENVKVYLVDSNEFKVKYYGSINCFMCNTKYELNATKSENSVKVSTTMYSFGFIIYTNLKMDIYLPKTFNKDLTIKTVSSDLSISDLTVENLKLSSTSGDILANNLIFNKGTFKTVSGDVELLNIKGDNLISIHTTSGDINGNNLEGKVDFGSISGNFDIMDNKGDISGATTSGDISIAQSSNNYIISLSSVSGDVVVDLNDDSSFHFKTSSISGNIKVSYQYTVDGNSSNNEHHKEGYIGDSLNNITINTTSGNIKIK